MRCREKILCQLLLSGDAKTYCSLSHHIPNSLKESYKSKDYSVLGMLYVSVYGILWANKPYDSDI